MIFVDNSAVAWLRLWRCLAVLALLFGFASLARANCSVNVDGLAMGQYDPVGSHATAPNDSGTTTVLVDCRKREMFEADLGPGANASGIQRRMIAGPGKYLGYGVFLDAGRSVPFGSQSGGLKVSCDTGRTTTYCDDDKGRKDDKVADFTLFGRIPGGQDPVSGAYRDTLMLTISF